VKEHVLVCEPQCHGFEHALVNSGLLCTLLLAFPEAKITFLGEASHSAQVRSGLDSAVGHAMSQRITWKLIFIPPRNALNGQRLVDELAWSRKLFGLESRLKPGLIVVSSVTNTGLLALKAALASGRVQTPVIAVPHAVLASLIAPPPRRPWNRLLALKVGLWLPKQPNLKYIALGAAIHGELARTFPNLAPQFGILDLAYFWACDRASAPPSDGQPVRFGFLGSASKGFDAFAGIARAVRETAGMGRAEFTLVGFVAEPAMRRASTKWVAGVSADPLSRDEFARRASQLTYPVALGNPRHYRLTASATFLDALSYVKPGIYLRNPFVEHYFRQMGDIGYLCETVEEVKQTIESIVREFPAERYRRQCGNILGGRKIFEPASLAPQLRRIVEGLRFSTGGQP
jgi:hypothetical protein